MVNFKEKYHFSRFRRGPNFSRGGRGGGDTEYNKCLFPILLIPYTAKTRSDRDKLCHFWSKMKLQESQNKPFLFIASYLVHLILEGFC